MPVTYRRLWAKLSYIGWTKDTLRKKVKMSWRTITKMGKNETVNLETILKICEVLDCQPSDILEYIPESEQKSATATETTEKKETPSA
jgi:DNA-binding Xre family transcriptional regulator